MSNCGCDNLELAELAHQQTRVLKWVLAINLVAFAMMVTGAWLSGSTALLSGTLDNLGDALTYALSLAVVGASVTAKARVALVKGLLIMAAALFVAGQIFWQLLHPETPIFTTMGLAAVLNLGANLVCLWLLSPHRHTDVNMASVYECSKNDVYEGMAVIAAAVAVGLFESAWPDLIIAIALLVLFTRSSIRVLQSAWSELKAAPA